MTERRTAAFAVFGVVLAMGCGDDGREPDSGTSACVDCDSDGFRVSDGDCDDYDDTRYPGATEAEDTVDNDCDGWVDECEDGYPGAPEVCDGLDNDCDGSIDEEVLSTYYLDADSDGYGNDSEAIEACSAPTGYVAFGGDCEDSDAAIHPNAVEQCDEVDRDCNGIPGFDDGGC